jgi:hypothetical protein
VLGHSILLWGIMHGKFSLNTGILKMFIKFSRQILASSIGTEFQDADLMVLPVEVHLILLEGC